MSERLWAILVTNKASGNQRMMRREFGAESAVPYLSSYKPGHIPMDADGAVEVAVVPVAELERLRRIEAAARTVDTNRTFGVRMDADHVALRAALEAK